VFLVKLAILAFYLRIFIRPGTLIRQHILAAMAVAILGLISFAFAGIFGCRPIYFYWERWDNTKEGQCLDINGLMWSNAAISITVSSARVQISYFTIEVRLETAMWGSFIQRHSPSSRNNSRLGGFYV
jgi:hypothetical protein